MFRPGLHFTIVALTWLPGGWGDVRAESLEERFHAEAPRGWERWKESERRIAGVLHIESWSTEDGRETVRGFDRSLKFARDGDLVRLISRSAGADGEMVLAAGERYGFSLARGSPSGPYLLRGLTFGPPSVTGEPIATSTYFYRAIQAPRELWNVPLGDLVEDPGFVLKRITEERDGAKPVVRVEFNCDSSKYNLKFLDAWMALSPSEDWSLLQAEYSHRSDYRVRILNEYSTGAQGRPVLAKHTRRSRYTEHNLDEVYQFTLDELKFRLVPDSEFTLTAFGLPEPTEGGRAGYGSTLHYWLFGGAAILFASAIGLRMASRRAT